YDQFILFGDSITQGDGNPALGYSCFEALQHDYSRRVDIIARGFSGYNTENALAVLPKIFPTPKQARVRLVTIFFGANDASLPNTTGQHLPLPTFAQNLKALVQNPAIQAHANIKLLLITPPPIDEWAFDSWDEPGKSARKAEVARAYAEAVVQVGKELQVAVANLWSACMVEAGWDDKCGGWPLSGDRRAERSEGLARLLTDGLHLSGDGYKILYQEMKKVIAVSYPELKPSSI
ncbi:SGNH hydrolase, partial [Cucurbitaria berberidis CBS 394.84]